MAWPEGKLVVDSKISGEILGRGRAISDLSSKLIGRLREANKPKERRCLARLSRTTRARTKKRAEKTYSEPRLVTNNINSVKAGVRKV